MIAHVDVDAFYASVEVRDNPSLRGKALAVAGSSRRAVVLTASYEARPFGVRSALPLYQALALCPQLVVVPPRMQRYREVSAQIFAILRDGGDPVEGLSLDEAFVDFGECGVAAARARAAELRRRICDEVGLTVSAGVAGGKMVAKILSDSCKPDGLSVLEAGSEAAFLAPLPVGRLWGVGPKTQARLQERGISTIGDVAALRDEEARSIFGSWGFELRDLARGIDRRSVDSSRETKSISTEETFEYDVRDEEVLRALLREQANELAEKLAREGLCACGVGIKVKDGTRKIISRQTNLSEPTQDARRIYAASVYCLRRAELGGRPVRLLGTRVASLVPGIPKQQSLFTGTQSKEEK